MKLQAMNGNGKRSFSPGSNIKGNQKHWKQNGQNFNGNSLFDERKKLPMWSARAGNVQQFMFWEHNQSDTTKHGTIPDTGTLLLKVHIF